MATIKRRSTVPYYAAAGTWVLYAAVFPLYKAGHFLLLAIVSAVVFLVMNAICGTQTVEVPSFTGLTAGAANQLAVSNGINLILSGPSQTAGATVYKQSVEKNTEVQAGSSITVYFQTTANMDD